MRLLVSLFGRFFRKQADSGLTEKKRIELEKRFEGGARLDKKPVAQQFLPHVKIAARVLVDQLGNIRDQWVLTYERRMGFPPLPTLKAPVEDHASKLRTRFFRLLLVLAGGFDFLVGYAAGPVWINLRITFLARVLGLMVALLIAAVFMAVWGLSPRDHSNPTPFLERCERWMWLTAGCAALLLICLLMERSFSLPASLLKFLFTATSVALSMLAAGSHILAEEYDGLNRLVREHHVVQGEYRRLQILIMKMEALLEPQELEQSLKFERELQRIEAEEVHRDS